MAEAFTCKSMIIGKAPKKIALLGDKERCVESAQHIIEFPGGAIELSRTSDGNYWAHIIVNRQYCDNDFKGMHNAIGKIIGARIDCDSGVMPIPEYKEISQIAVLIKPIK